MLIFFSQLEFPDGSSDHDASKIAPVEDLSQGRFLLLFFSSSFFVRWKNKNKNKEKDKKLTQLFVLLFS